MVTAWKVPKYEFFFWPVFFHIQTDLHNLFSPNAGKYGPEKTPCLDTFHAVGLNSDFMKSPTLGGSIVEYNNVLKRKKVLETFSIKVFTII